MKIFFVAVLALLLSGCDFFRGPTAPSHVGSDDVSAWYPCVIVQPAGQRGSNEFNNQINALKKLRNASKLAWVRFGSTNNTEYYDEARAMGLKVFSIISTDQLESGASWQSVFDSLYIRFPSDMWEITGEISNPEINGRLLTPEEYMRKFKELYTYIRNRYPGTVLVSAPTLGSSGGAREFERFIQAGLLEMDVVVAVNIYTPVALNEYAGVFSRYGDRLSRRRIWVTETGADDPNGQIDWVRNFYPQIINIIHPEMICWYATWTGDNVAGNGFGLLDKVSTTNYVERDLFRLLTGGM